MTPIHPNATTTQTGPETPAVAAARGYLAAAIDAIPATHPAVLELSAAWSHLDQPGLLPTVTDPAAANPKTVTQLLASARDALIDAGLLATTPTRIITLALAARHLAAAQRALPPPHGEHP